MYHRRNCASSWLPTRSNVTSYQLPIVCTRFVFATLVSMKQHIIFVVNEHEVWWSMKNMKIHVFVLFKLKVASTLSCSCFYRNYNSVTSLQLCSALTLAWAGGLRHFLCIWDVAGYDLNPETVCIDICDFSQSFQCALRILKGARIVSFDILCS
jgi:hypothetical protein